MLLNGIQSMDASSVVDSKLQNIYNRYHMGRTIILDDLKYVSAKDPDGCDSLLKSIVFSQTDEEYEKEQSECIEKEHKECIQEQEEIKEKVIIQDFSEKGNLNKSEDGYVDCMDHEHNPEESIDNISNIISSIKSIFGELDEYEKIDMLKNLFHELDLMDIGRNLNYWEDAYSNKLTMFTYDEKKKFNMLA